MDDAAAARLPHSVFALAFIPVVFHLAIVATNRVPHLAWHPAWLLRNGFVTASALGHWAIYTTLFTTFALTLRPGREPLIAAMARRLHGPLPDELALYTRRVTIAWSAFFAAQLVSSITLFMAAPLVAWSFFVNILDLPLVAAMFAAEYAVRLRCLRDPPRHSLAAIIGMIAEARKLRAEPLASP